MYNIKSKISLLDKYIINRINKLRKHYGITAEEIATSIFSTVGFIRQVESYNKHYNHTHLFYIFLLIKEKEQKFELQNFFPNENYHDLEGFSLKDYPSFQDLIEAIKKDSFNRNNERKKLQNKNMEE